MKLTKRPGWALGALAAGASIAVTIGLATPAQAALSGSDWTMAKLAPDMPNPSSRTRAVTSRCRACPGRNSAWPSSRT